MDILLKTFTCVKKAQKQENSLLLRKLVLKAVEQIKMYDKYKDIDDLPNKYYILSENAQRFICKIYASSNPNRLNMCNILSYYRLDDDELSKVVIV